MRSIFWKIFLSFWLLMAVVLAVTLRISLHLASERSAQVDEIRRIDILRDANEALQDGGRVGFERWLRNEVVLPPAQTVYLIDTDGQDILGRDVPKDVILGYKKHQRMHKRQDRWQRLSNPDDGRSYLFLFGPTRPPMLGVLSTPGVTTALFVVALVISALVCFLLTRYLTAPLRPVMDAAERLTDGDLDARSGITHPRADELGELATRFDTMADALQRQLESRQDLLRNISHELRSPLARILVALELAERQPDSTPRQLRRIANETQHMDMLTGQILDLARAQAHPEQHAPIDLAALLERIADDARFEGRPDDKQIVVEANQQAPVVTGQATLLHSAIENVVRNALRFSPAGGRVTIRVRRRQHDVLIDILDQGPGVAEDELESIFEPFTCSEDDHSAGVGLALTRQIMALHGGRVSAANRPAPQRGLCVTLRLPLADD